MQPAFFLPADLHAFQQRLQSNYRYNSQDEADQEMAQDLKANIFAKTAYWTEEVRKQLPSARYTHIMRQQWEQRHFLRRYSWGRFFLTEFKDKGFYFTLGVDSGETKRAKEHAAQGFAPAGPALILKIDVHRTDTSSFPAPHREAGEALLHSLPLTTTWHRIGADVLPEYDWHRLITESVAFINEHENDLRRIWAVSGQPDTRLLGVAQLGDGLDTLIPEGKRPVVLRPREQEANDEHIRLSNKLQALLPTYGFTEVRRSCPINYPRSLKHKREVDLKAVDAEGRLTFFEIKALSSLNGCIREALGQLLEYAYWAAPADAPLASRLVIATPHALTTAAQQYLSRLRKEFNLNLQYVQIEAANNLLLFTPD